MTANLIYILSQFNVQESTFKQQSFIQIKTDKFAPVHIRQVSVFSVNITHAVLTISLMQELMSLPLLSY